jgi:hypothetical protein
MEGWLEYKDKTAFGSHPWKKRWVRVDVETGRIILAKVSHQSFLLAFCQVLIIELCYFFSNLVTRGWYPKR